MKRNILVIGLFLLAFAIAGCVTVAPENNPNIPSGFNRAESYWAAGEYSEAIQYYKSALTQTADRDWMWMLFGKLSECHLQLKQYDEAIKTAQMGLQLALKSTAFPTTGPSHCYYDLALAYRGKGQYDKAIYAVKKYIALRPEYGAGYAVMAGILDDRKDYEQAVVYWGKAIELDPDKFDLARSYYYWGIHNDDDTLDLLNKLIDSSIFGGIGCSLKFVDGYPVIYGVSKGGPAWEKGLVAGDRIAKVDGKSTKEQSPKEILNWLKGKEGTKVTLNIMRAGLKKPRTVTLTREKITPKTAAIYIAFRSLIQRHRGKAEDALRDAKAGYSLDPDKPYTNLALGASYLDRRQYDEAVKLLSRVHSDNRLLQANAHILETTAYAKKGDFNKATDIYSAISEGNLSPKNVPLWSDRTALLKAMKPFIASKMENADSLKAQGRHKEALSELGAALMIADDGMSEEICRSIHKIISMDPRLSELSEEARKYALRGDVMTEEGNFEEAAKEYRKAVQSAPYIAKLYFNTAMIYGEFKGYAQAVRYMKTYLQLAPEAPNARAAKDQIYKWEFMAEKGK